MFFVPGYIVKQCRSGESRELFLAWWQAENREAKGAAALTLAEYFRHRRGERDQIAAEFLVRQAQGELALSREGVDPVRERNSYGYFIRRCCNRSSGQC